MHNYFLKLISELQAMAQNGLTYSTNEYELAVYKRLMIISAELTSHLTKKDMNTIFELFSAEKGYRTPKVEVRGAVFKDNKILLVKEKDDGLWSLPGGWADVNYSVSENVTREIFEESGLICKVNKLIGIYDKNKYLKNSHWPQVYKIFFLCDNMFEGQPAAGLDTLDVDFFAIDKLPDLSLERVNKFQIERCFTHYNQPNMLSDFDDELIYEPSLVAI